MVEIVDISSIIDINSEGLLTPEEIAKKEITEFFPSRYFSHALFFDPDINHVRKYFKDQIVVDVGSGTDICVYRASCIAESRAYVGVDCNNDYDSKLMSFLLSPEFWEKHDKKFGVHGELLNHPRNVPAALVYEPAQDFLRRLPDNSVSVYSGGVDACIMPEDEKARDLEEQIIRVLHPEGAFMGHCTRLFRNFSNYSPTEGLTLVDSAKGYPNMDLRVKNS